MLAGPHHDESVPASPAGAPSASTVLPLRTAAAHAEVELDSARLLQGRREVVIRHAGQCYRLRHTRNDKLILTK